jgi:hypothetical protein
MRRLRPTWHAHPHQFPNRRNPGFPVPKEAATTTGTAGSTPTAGAMILSEVPEVAEVMELERRVLICSAEGRAVEMASAIAEVVAGEVGGEAASKLAWVVGRRISQVLVGMGEDIFRDEATRRVRLWRECRIWGAFDLYG